MSFTLNLNDKIEDQKGIEESVFQDCRRKTGGNSALYVVYADGNHLKKINDTYGHDVGNEVIEAWCDALAENTRRGDRIIKTGGDEFVLMIPNFNPDIIKPFISRIHNAVRIKTLAVLKKYGADAEPAEMSMAVVKYREAVHGESFDGVAKVADSRMYKVKLAFKNNLILHCLAYDGDEIPEIDSKTVEKRAKSKHAKKLRLLFNTVYHAITSENPEIIRCLLIDSMRELWAIQKTRVTNERTLDELINLTKSIYQRKYKTEMIKLIKENEKDIKDKLNKQLEEVIEKKFNDNHNNLRKKA